jgi:DNA-binding MarR family transcriptional regulator
MARFDAAAHLPLTPAMFQVLVALADGEKHGYAVIKEVARRTDGKVRLRAGTLYTVIRRFVDDGLIQESSERPDPSLDDERRRYYRLTAAAPWPWPRRAAWPRPWRRPAPNWE